MDVPNSVSFVSCEYRESSYQPILPGLPDDLALRCLAKIPHGYHGSLETVSKRWRDVLRSTEYSSCKAKEGWSGDWVFVITGNGNTQWIAYDPDADRWHPIPMIPKNNEYALTGGYGCVCVGNRFLVIGGSCFKFDHMVGPRERRFMTNKVFQFDTFTKEWSEAASMRTPRTYFGCCVMSGKVYVCGGANKSHLDGLALAEVYDPLTNKWEELPQMHNKLIECLSLSHNGNFYALENELDPNYNPLNCHSHRAEIFDTSKWVWRTEDMQWPCSNYGGAEVQVTEDGQMYAHVHVEDEENVVKRKDNRGEWHAVAKLPSLLACPPDGLLWSGEVSGNGFVALGNELYFIGGEMSGRDVMGVKPEEDKDLELDRCWIWDGKWRETRRMCRPWCGRVKGVAALKEKKMSTI